MGLNLRILHEAEREIEAAVAFYNGEQDYLGLQFLDEVQRSFSNIILSPNAWPRARNSIRKYLVKRFPYIILFQVRPQEILIIAVSHMRRKPDYWVDRIPNID